MESRRFMRKRLRRRRVRVLLAAGVVLGLGTASTLAAWTDVENATAAFSASVFGTESQSAGSSTYASNTSAPGAALTFTPGSGLSPGVASYAWLNIRTTPASTVAGTVSLTGVTPSGGLAPALQYRAVRMTAANPTGVCDATAFSGTPAYIAGASGTYLPVTQLPASPVANAIGAAGAQLGFCFEVRIAPGAADSFQGQTATVTWTFTATSAG